MFQMRNSGKLRTLMSSNLDSLGDRTEMSEFLHSPILLLLAIIIITRLVMPSLWDLLLITLLFQT